MKTPASDNTYPTLCPGDRLGQSVPADADHGRGYAAAVGVFDGLHRGHRYMIEALKKTAEERNLAPVAVTFDDHPTAMLQPPGVELLMPHPTRLRALADSGAEVRVMPFERVRPLTARQFVDHLAAMDVRMLVTGWDTRFGSDQPASPETYDALCRARGIEICHLARNGSASSRHIRQALREGDLAAANDMLGRPYRLEGRVGEGRRLGRTIGVPTANLVLDEPRQLVPATGVYASVARVGGRQYRAVTNIGHRPTVDHSDSPTLTIETHIPGFDADIYGHHLDIDLLARLRPERAFDSLDALRRQIDRDIQQSLHTPHPWKN